MKGWWLGLSYVNSFCSRHLLKLSGSTLLVVFQGNGSPTGPITESATDVLVRSPENEAFDIWVDSKVLPLSKTEEGFATCFYAWGFSILDLRMELWSLLRWNWRRFKAKISQLDLLALIQLPCLGFWAIANDHDQENSFIASFTTKPLRPIYC